MDKPTYQRAVTPTMDTNGVPSANPSLARGKLLSYQSNQMRRGTNVKGVDSVNSNMDANASHNLLQGTQQLQSSLQEAQSQVHSGPVNVQSQAHPQRGVYGDMGIQGRATGNKTTPLSAGNNTLTGPIAVGVNDALAKRNAAGSIAATSNSLGEQSGVSGTVSMPRFDLVPLCEDIPADGIIFARFRNNPESLVVFRSPEERLRNPERLNLDRRQLDVCPVMEQELRLRLLNFQNNNIRQIQNLENLPNLIFLDLYNNKLTSLEGPLASVKGLRVLMAGKNRISAISNLTALRKLDVLDLHSNDIKQIEGLQGLADLRVLNLAGNSIPVVQNLTSLQALTELNLRRNVIEKVYELDKLPALQRVFLSHNSISNLVDMECLFNVRHLIELSLDGNPISDSDPAVYRAKIISGMSGLRHLDLKRISDEERVAAGSSRKAVEQELGWKESDDAAGPVGSVLTGDLDTSLLHNIDADSASRFGESDVRDISHDSGQMRGIAALARSGKVPNSQSLFDVELIGPVEKALVVVGETWDWVQAKRLLVNVTEASLYHMKRSVIISKFASNISWLPSLKCLRLVNNELESFKDIDSIFESFGSLLSLDHLCIRDNPICALQNLLRAYMIVSFPGLKTFNEVDIKDSERKEAVHTLEPVLRIHNLAMSQAQLPVNAPNTKGGQFGTLLKARPAPNQAPKRTLGKIVSGGSTGVATDEQFVSDLCSEISATAIRRRKFKTEFDAQLRESVKQIFVDTVLQLHTDRQHST